MVGAAFNIRWYFLGADEIWIGGFLILFVLDNSTTLRCMVGAAFNIRWYFLGADEIWTDGFLILFVLDNSTPLRCMVGAAFNIHCTLLRHGGDRIKRIDPQRTVFARNRELHFDFSIFLFM
jgi:hypothetical protein